MPDPSASPPSPPKTNIRTRSAILELLKKQGPTNALRLARQLNLTGMAVRQHLYDLQRQKLVDFQTIAQPKGRPAKLWTLTPEARKYFPDAHADLVVGLVQSLRSALGPEALEKVLNERQKQIVQAYSMALPSAPMSARIEALAELRSQEGYMAEWHENPDGSFILIENHCPICSAAAVCQGLCQSEMEIFELVAGANYQVKRLEHIQAGDRRCFYSFSPRKLH